ncbi:MAG: fibronectin type III domain-containing protein [Roseburia sp.]|nr:fibronectin type III domain-containing protein [Roseburia sp.]
MKKRISALILALMMVFGTVTPAFAQELSGETAESTVQVSDAEQTEESEEPEKAADEAGALETGAAGENTGNDLGENDVDSQESDEQTSEIKEDITDPEDETESAGIQENSGTEEQQTPQTSQGSANALTENAEGGDDVTEEAATEEAIPEESATAGESEQSPVDDADQMSEEEFEALNDPLYSKYMYGIQTMSEYQDASDLIHNSRFDKYLKIQGIDVSKYQGDINWSSVKNSGISFAMIRLGYRGMEQGTLQLDSYFDTNMSGAHAAGMTIGIYFFTQALNVAEAEEEAQYVINQLSRYPGYVTYPVVIDMEGLDGSRLDNAGLSVAEKTAICRAFCAKIESAGYTAGVYSGKYYYETQLDAESLAKDYYIWMANYTNQTSYAGTYNMWQYTSSGSVNGISGRVDMDIAYVPTVPGKTTGLKQTAATTNSVSLSWNAVTNADGYKVYRYDAQGNLLQSYNVTDTKTTTSNLTEGTTYQYRVAAFYKNSDGTYQYGSKSSAYNVYTTPGQVTGVTVKTRYTDGLTLSWNSLSGVTGYRIAKFNPDKGKYELVGTTTGTSYKITGLEVGTNYMVKVQGYVNLNGTDRNVGAYSTPLSTYTSPAQITGLATTAVTGDSVSLTWKAQSGITGYRVYWYDTSGTQLGTQYVTTNSFKHSSLPEGAAYQYKVRSYIKTDTETIWGKLSAAVTVKLKPGKVTSLSVSSASTNKMIVKWTAVNGAEGYRVCLYDEDTKKYTILGTTTKTSYTIGNLDAGTRYSVRVAAYVNDGSKIVLGTYSASLKAATKPVQVTGVKQTAKTTSSITLSWSAVKNVSGYRVYRYDTDGNLLGSVYVDGTQYTDTALNAGKYTYKVRAYVKADDYTAWGDYSAALQAATKPKQVTGLYKSSASTDRIVVRWSEVEGADGYRVCLYDENTKKYTILGTTENCVYNIKNLEPGTEYSIRVAAYYKDGSKLNLGTYSESLKAETKTAN